jgi:hypothetical protein
MAERRKIEVFTAGCPCCTEAVELVEFLAATQHDVEIRDMHDPAVAVTASGYGIRRLPVVVIDGRLAGWYAGRSLDEATLTLFAEARCTNPLPSNGKKLARPSLL